MKTMFWWIRNLVCVALISGLTLVASIMIDVYPIRATTGHAADETAASDRENWRIEVNRTVAKTNHWRWTVRYVERNADTLTVRISVRNNGSQPRPLYLGPGFESKIALVDQKTQQRFELLSVSGVSVDFLRVDRKKSAPTTFVFRYPEGLPSVNFSSEWLTFNMGGEKSVMNVEFPISLQPQTSESN